LSGRKNAGLSGYQEALQTYADYVGKYSGMSPVLVNFYIDHDNTLGLSQRDNPNIGLNLGNLNLGYTEDILYVTGHEMGHQYNPGGSQPIADLYARKILNAWEAEKSESSTDLDSVLIGANDFDQLREGTRRMAGDLVAEALTLPYIGWVDAGEARGEASALWYADRFNESGILGKAGYGLGGLVSSLWTPETSDTTFKVLYTAYDLRNAGHQAFGSVK
jgi:hypothetical protein